MQRKLVLELCLKRGEFGLLEMYILLTNDIIEFEGYSDLRCLDTLRKQMSIDIEIPCRQHQDLLLLLLRARCPVSNNGSNMTSSY